MTLNRFAAELAQSFRLPLERPLPWVRAVVPWFVLALAAHFGGRLALPGEGFVPFLANALAFGAFAVTWQRFVALGEEPGQPLAWRIGPRHLLWALAYQALVGVEAAPLLLLGPALADMADGTVIGIAVQEAFQLLIGPVFLLLPHIALYRKGTGGASLQEMTLAGGLSVGFGYVLANLPFLMISLAWADVLPQLGSGPVPEAAAGVMQFLLSFAGVTVSAAFFAQVWSRLRAEAPRLRPEAAAEPSPPRPRRTERLQRGKRSGGTSSSKSE